MSEAINKIQRLISGLDRINEKLKPLDQIEKMMQKQIDDADKEFAYTNKRPDTNWTVSINELSLEVAIHASCEIDTKTLIKAIQSSSIELREERKEITKKLNKINEFFKDQQ